MLGSLLSTCSQLHSLPFAHFLAPRKVILVTELPGYLSGLPPVDWGIQRHQLETGGWGEKGSEVSSLLSPCFGTMTLVLAKSLCDYTFFKKMDRDSSDGISSRDFPCKEK